MKKNRQQLVEHLRRGAPDHLAVPNVGARALVGTAGMGNRLEDARTPKIDKRYTQDRGDLLGSRPKAWAPWEADPEW